MRSEKTFPAHDARRLSLICQTLKEGDDRDVVDSLVLKKWLQIHCPQKAHSLVFEVPPSMNSSECIAPPVLRSRRRKLDDNSVENSVQEDMIQMAHEMKEVAYGLHATIRTDFSSLESTSLAQEKNLNLTSKQVASSQSLSRNSRISVLIFLFMMTSSLLTFVFVVALIIYII
jgi:hypothetical protein